MRSDVLRLTAGAVACLLVGCSAVWAQQAPAARPEVAKPLPAGTTPSVAPTPSVVPGPPTTPGVLPGGRVEEAQPSIIYVRDPQGKLVPVVGFTQPEFDELYKLKHQLMQGDQRPRCSLQQMSANGSVVGDYAELSIQFRILVREEQWTRVPLRLDQGILREPPQYQGPGEQFLQFEGGGAGYVAWIRGPAGQQHQITLKMLMPLLTAGEVTRLHLLVPRATASELRLKVPLSGAVAKVSEGATLRTPNSAKNETELTVVGLGGDFELTWHRPEARIAEAPTVLEAQGLLAARLDNRGVDAEATLTVRSYGRLFDTFRVRLPQDAEFVPGTPNGYTVAVLDGAAPPGSRQKVVEVRLPKQTTGPVEVRLATNRATDTTKPGPWLELAGFEVVGAARQWGTVAVSVVGDWQILWGPSAGVQQTDQVPEAVRRGDVVAAFDYVTQPCSLSARLVPRKTRIGVEPEYLLSVESDAVRLDAKLRYTVRGGKVFALDVLMPDWQIDEIGPDSLVAVDGVPKGTSGGTLSIPLLQPSSGQFEVRMRAHRPLTAAAKSLVVPLPQPQATASASVVLVVLPAVLVVLPADNVELIPGGEATTGLFRQQGTIPMELPPRQQEPLFYRSEAKAVFAAEIRRHAGQISVDVASQADLDGQGGRVEQKLAYLVSYEPTDHVLLDVPRRLAESGRLDLKCDGQAVTPVALGEGADDASQPVRMRVALSKATIGLCELSIRYVLLARKPAAEKRAVVPIPLVMPAEGDLLSNRLRVMAAAELHVQPRPGPWAVVEAGLPPASRSAAERRGLQLAAAGRSNQVELEVEGQSAGQPDVVLDRAWLQTWLTGEVRRDRAVFQFTSSRREFELTLPAGAVLDQPGAAVDGKSLPAAVIAENTLVVPLAGQGGAPGEAGWGRHTVEVRYHMADPRSPRGAMTLELPHPPNGAWVRQMYWQLVLPRDEHVVLAPRNFTGESTWGWSGSFWGRQPLLDQAQLEEWVGLPPAERDLAAGGVNEYLFSTLGSINDAELRTASRSLIVLAASGAVLLAGLLLIYWPKARHPASLLVATVALAGVLVWMPEPALLAAQAAVLGLVLALVAGLLSYTLGRRRSPLWAETPGSAIGSSIRSGRTPHPAAAGAPGEARTSAEPRPAGGAGSGSSPSGPPSTTPPTPTEAKP